MDIYKILELIAIGASLLYILFATFANKLMWLFGLMSSILYIIIFSKNQLYANIVLYAYYVFISIIGWYNWSKSDVNKSGKGIRKVRKKELIVYISVILILFVIFYLILKYLPTIINIPLSESPFLDAFTTAAAFVASYMLVKKILEQWILWIVIDIFYVFLFFEAKLNFILVLSFIYIATAFWGYFSWLKLMKKQN